MAKKFEDRSARALITKAILDTRDTVSNRKLTPEEKAAQKKLKISGVETAIGSFLPKRKGGGGIEPSIPAKYDAETGKVVLLDIVQHSKECAELIKQGVVPLISGYIYIDKQAYDTLQSRKLLDASGDFESDAVLVGGKFSSAPNAQLGFVSDNEAKRILKLRKETEFYIEVDKLKTNKLTYVKIIPLLWNADIDKLEFEPGNLVYDAFIDYITNTTFKTNNAEIHLYFTSNPLLNSSPYPNSKYFRIKVKSDDPTSRTIDITNAKATYVYFVDSKNYEALSVVSKDIYDDQGAGHLKAVKTSEVSELIRVAEELKIDESFLAGSDAEIMGTLKIFIDILKQDLEELREIDRIFGSPATYFNDSLPITFENLRSGANQLGMGIFFSVVTEKGVQTTKAPAFVDMLATIDGVSTPESSIINSFFKGSETGNIILKVRKAWERAARQYAERFLTAAAKNQIGLQTSDSLLQATLIVALGEIFGIYDISKKTNLSKKKQGLITLANNYKKLKKFKIPVFKSKKLSFSLKKSSSSRSFSATTQRTAPNIVSLINAEIYKYVRAQMSENTLQYRTGEFARSVRVLSAQENAAVQYTYKKNPYSDVFSPGKSYLATEDRNPAKIIDAAIKRLGQDRFQKVFRTEEV